MSTLNYVTVDVFTKQKFVGNQLAIVELPPTGLTQDQKQTIAREFNYSETTFVHPTSVYNEWTVDIFTIDQELPFAGHPTIGTACHLLRSIAKDSAIVSGIFNVKAGCIELEYDVATETAKASIPHNVHIHQAVYTSTELARLQPNVGVLPASSPVVSIVTGMTFILVELDSLDALTFVNVTSYPIQVKLDGGKADSFVSCYFYVQSPPNEDGVIRIQTRMIESSIGEDPATGSAASALACYLTLEGRKVGVTSRYEIVQGVEMGRRSKIGVDVNTTPTGEINSVMLSGSAVQVMEGKISV